jgi:hypothetical protein
MESVINTAALVVVAVAAFIHLKAMRKARNDCESVGFAIVMAGAVGCALEPWWPSLVKLVGLAGERPSFFVETVFHVGLALVAVAMLRGDLRELLERAGRILARRDASPAPAPLDVNEFMARRFERTK